MLCIFRDKHPHIFCAVRFKYGAVCQLQCTCRLSGLVKLHSMGRFDSFTYSPTGNLYVPQDPEYTKLALDELVEESGVDYLLCCQAVQADTEGGRCRPFYCGG